MTLRGSGFRRLGPWWLVAAAIVAALVLFFFKEVRLGGQVMAAAFAGAAVIRAVTNRSGAGGIAVRNKAFDVTVLLLLALGVLIASATVKLDVDQGGRALAPRAVQVTADQVTLLGPSSALASATPRRAPGLPNLPTT